VPLSFEWEIEEQSGPPRHLGEGRTPPTRSRRRLRWIVVTLALLALIAFSVRAWVLRRLQTLEKTEEGLHAAVELELKALADGDADLFRSRQDPTDRRWQRDQVQRFIVQDPTFNLPAPGLQPVDRPWEIEEIELLGRSAQVDLLRWFQNPLDERDSGLPLRLTWFYRQEEDGGWYHVPPPEDYWGVPHWWSAVRLDVRGSEKEAELLRPIVDDLAMLVLEGCQLFECPPGLHYSLNLEDTLRPQITGDRWALPSLVWTGLPAREMARAVWEGAMRRWVVEALAESQVREDALTGRVIYRVLVSRLQARWGLTEPLALDAARLARALGAHRAHTLAELWQAQYADYDPEEAWLLETEASALLEVLAERVGADRVYALLPALREHAGFEEALRQALRLELAHLETVWFGRLSELSGVSLVDLQSGLQPALESGGSAALSREQDPLPSRTNAHLALVCDDRIWAGDLGGEQWVPLTVGGERFRSLFWSPDGRWLLTSWQPNITGAAAVLYLLAADGSRGFVFPAQDAAHVLPLGWSGDGQEVVDAFWRKEATFPMEIRAMDIQTGETRVLPGLPTWSPDGEHVTYVTESFGTAWLADADGGNVRPIADRAWAAWQGQVWSPDGAKIALQLDDADQAQSTVGIFDTQSGRLTELLSAGELEVALENSGEGAVTDGIGPVALQERPLRWVWPMGWSADGERILVWAHGTDRRLPGHDLSALAAIPLDGSAPQALAYVDGSFLGGAAWSPTHPQRLAFTWLPQADRGETPTAYLFDLIDGPLYASHGAQGMAWSPDGAWIAFLERGEVRIVDETGQLRFTLQPEGTGSCSAAVWNPAAAFDRFAIPQDPASTFTP
jgi:hypothetical protein